MNISHLELVIRLILSVLLGGLVGFERERHNRPAGFRTHILVCVGCALVMLVSMYAFTSELGEVGRGADPSRMASHAVSGIGFLGAGTIMRYGNTIRGLTTAASLWVVAIIGLAVGSGFYVGALVTTFLLLSSLYALRGVEVYLARQQRLRKMAVMAVDKPGLLGKIGDAFGEMNINIHNLEMGPAEYLEAYKTNVISLDFLLKIPYKLKTHEMLKKIVQINEVLEISWDGEEVDKRNYPYSRPGPGKFMDTGGEGAHLDH
ncbi:MgtC/SapB family protein [Candidatus Contubernalis alkaliaceticus]|uniref:MgtC/SapB family protein n=1 Tax=Candidatus Contubernalis alkaliaceticus TaxID=338645 RepID=UPI001F4C5267|nr:MgtC/SapB family protein [Candidatus Contubernalis alkalaceticus]UNC93389.1 MgtC/SapB family protein [Candidatus Contubernalis alkalaceticus]